MNSKTSFHAIGLMSGSSLDGLDICYVAFTLEHPKDWRNIDYEIIQATCVEYDDVFKNKLRVLPNSTALEISSMHKELGNYFGSLTAQFIKAKNLQKIDFICSHGQTIFHQPMSGFTTQIGCGAQIAAKTGYRVVCDLRSSDIAHGGQGAPIVPIAEQYLFKDYSLFLNLGGIANISIHHKDGIIGFDICAANTVLNYLAQEKGAKYDADGRWARSGNIIPELLEALNTLPFCNADGPKSLGTEHVMTHWIALCNSYKDSIEDKLATVVEHIALQVAISLEKHSVKSSSGKMMITGGGALNIFLTERIAAHSCIETFIPDIFTIQYKEALAMAMIGLLRLEERSNCLASVTGAERDTIGGAIYMP